MKNKKKLNLDKQNYVKTSAFDSDAFIANCSLSPGVYQMYDQNGDHLYVGKAKNLKKRLASYFRPQEAGSKTESLVSKIENIDITVTASETEALILEHNLIKSNKPPYNVLLRDDKSYPYIYLSSEHKYPRLAFHRGKQTGKGKYYGPYPNKYAVKDSLKLLQKIFKVRQCEDSFFKNRSRPCLQHQIGRCSAPCVKKIDVEEYSESVNKSILFLKGEKDELTKKLTNEMDSASESLKFEEAAEIRDQIVKLRRIQENQFIEKGRGNIDIVAASMRAGYACVQLLFVRNGRMLGSRSYYPKIGMISSLEELIETFISQIYIAGNGSLDNIPNEIITNFSFDETCILSDALKQKYGKKIKLSNKVISSRARWLKMANETAEQNLNAKINARQQINKRFEAFQQDLGLDEAPQRIECFDISHNSGEQTVASCVVFTQEGAKKSDYRKFNIEGIKGGDDYAAIKQAIERRYTRIKKGEGVLPDILIVDGGKGQMSQALQVLEELQIFEVLVIGIAKGNTRKPGLENLFIGEINKTLLLPNDSSSLHLIQQIRDEAHRFAITGHRARRKKAKNTSPLESITGIGPKRRRDLLRYFGGWQEIERASIDDLAKVDGISHKLAENIHNVLHPH